MTPTLAVHLSPHQLPELQLAARALLRRPLITAAQPDELRLALRWETVLRNEFGQKLGYRLDVSRSAARLLRRPSSLTSTRGAQLGTGRHLSRWGYVYLCLTLAALEQPGHQVLASELLTRITQLARGDERLPLDSTEFVQRRAFRDAVRYLEELGVLSVRDGDVEALLNDGQVLWDIDRDAAAMCMVAAPSVLRSVTSVADFIVEPVPSDTEGRSRRARHLLNRRMVDQPVVLLRDLSVEEAELAWRNRRREADNIARLTGCEIELRREGLALIDHATDPISETSFPAGNSVAHAALLWLTALLERDADAADADDTDDDSDDSDDDADDADGSDDDVHGDVHQHRVVARAVAEELWAGVLDEYGSRLGKDAGEQPERFRASVDGLLERFGLVVSRPHGVAVSAFASRFRANPTVVDDPAQPSQQVMF